MHADLFRSHKLCRFVEGNGRGAVACLCVRKKVQDSMIPYVILCHVNFCLVFVLFFCLHDRQKEEVCRFVHSLIVYFLLILTS